MLGLFWQLLDAKFCENPTGRQKYELTNEPTMHHSQEGRHVLQGTRKPAPNLDQKNPKKLKRMLSFAYPD